MSTKFAMLRHVLILSGFLASLMAAPLVHAGQIGVWVDSNGLTPTACADEIDQLPAFVAQTGQPDYVHCFIHFSDPFPEAQVSAIEAMGSEAIVDWGCDLVSTVNSGADDSTITAFATAAAAHGKPMLMRIYREMNLSGLPSGQCMVDASPSDFVAAWQRIYDLFQAAGATNVAFVWCPANANTDKTYYPGDDVVDWLAFDSYDKNGKGAKAIVQWKPFFTTWAGTTKPIMIAETAAQDVDQAAFIAAWPLAFKRYAGLKAIVYFDGPGQSPWDWRLDAGLSAFAALVAAQTPLGGN